MVKNVLRTLLFSCLLILVSCERSPTYKRATAAVEFSRICKKEFKVDVKAWLVGETIWVYVPLSRMLDEKNQMYPDSSKNINYMFMVLRRMTMSIDNPPRFYAFVFSDIKDKGADLFYIGYVPDLVKMDFSMISLNQWYERSASSYAFNPKAIGDTEGMHFSRTDITMGDLLSFLVRQAIESAFAKQEVREYFKINSNDSYFYDGKLGVIFDIEQIKQVEPGKKITLPSPFSEACKAIRHFVTMYDYKEVTEIEINDIANKRQRYYSLPALMDSKED